MTKESIEGQDEQFFGTFNTYPVVEEVGIPVSIKKETPKVTLPKKPETLFVPHFDQNALTEPE